jgi:hypothetical protein
MLTKTITAVVTALVLATTLVAGANAQPNSAAERNWFEIPQGRDDGMPSRR